MVEKIVATHPSIGIVAGCILDQLIACGASLLRDALHKTSAAVSQVSKNENNYAVEHVYESFVPAAERLNFAVVYSTLTDGSQVHMAPFVNKLLNSTYEKDSTERLRRVQS